ncbi:MAG TPA: succinate dehydrogenase, hydrophobic membrane anchor protein [Micropepsaceae bacterium]|nr:succinate dehydrogenase, hydrophobic membrane anchor protein [Micropepsaceae bacterium]
MSAPLRTPLAKIEGLGSAKSGTLHFWHQRMTAVALVPLSIWFAASALAYVGADQGAVAAYFAEPVNAVPMFLFILASTYHMSLGMQMIIEDYIHQEGQKIAALILNRFAAWTIGAASSFALIKMALH